MNQLYDFLDCIGDHPLRAFLIAAVLVTSLAVWITLKCEDRKLSSKRRECSELERMYRA